MFKCKITHIFNLHKKTLHQYNIFYHFLHCQIYFVTVCFLCILIAYNFFVEADFSFGACCFYNFITLLCNASATFCYHI